MAAVVFDKDSVSDNNLTRTSEATVTTHAELDETEAIIADADTA